MVQFPVLGNWSKKCDNLSLKSKDYKIDEKDIFEKRKLTWFASKLPCNVWPQNLKTQHVLITIIWQEGKRLAKQKRYLTCRKVTSCLIFWGNYSKNLGNYGLRRECILGKCKNCVWVIERFQLSQFQLLRSQCIVPLNLVLGVQVQKHLTRLNSDSVQSSI